MGFIVHFFQVLLRDLPMHHLLGQGMQFQAELFNFTLIPALSLYSSCNLFLSGLPHLSKTPSRTGFFQQSSLLAVLFMVNMASRKTL